MTFTSITDHAAIRAALEPVIRADPVGGTVLGTVTRSLEDGAWCAFEDGRLATRSGERYPVTFAGAWDDGAAAEVAPLLAALPRLCGLSGPTGTVRAVLRSLDRSVLHRSEQALHRLDELSEPVGVLGSAVLADEARTDLVRGWFRAFASEAEAHRDDSDPQADRAIREHGCYLWLDPSGEPVSLAARRPVVAGSARVGPVYTPPGQRGHGYASAVTAAATRSILDEG